MTLNDLLFRYGCLLPGVPRLMRAESIEPRRFLLPDSKRGWGFVALDRLEFIGSVLYCGYTPRDASLAQESPLDILFGHHWAATKWGFKKSYENCGIEYSAGQSYFGDKDAPLWLQDVDLNVRRTAWFVDDVAKHECFSFCHLVGEIPPVKHGQLVRVAGLAGAIVDAAGARVSSIGTLGTRRCPWLLVTKWDTLGHLADPSGPHENQRITSEQRSHYQQQEIPRFIP